MKKLKFPVFILMLLLQSAFCFAQQTKTPYTVTVYNLAPSNPLVKGTKITANSQLLANTTYYVEVTSSTAGTLCCMRMTNADGFTTGYYSYPSLTWVNNVDPTGAQVDTGTKTMKFAIKTFADPDFVNQLYMKVSQCDGLTTSCANPGGAAQGWKNPIPFLFPYQ
jgi:hypothetical protein